MRAHWWFWGLLFCVPSLLAVLRAIVAGPLWLLVIPLLFLLVGGPGEHLFRAWLRHKQSGPS
jgi:hypothetical protein